MKTIQIFTIVMLGLVSNAAMAQSGIDSTLKGIEQCGGLMGDELKRCLGQKGVLGVIGGFFGVNVPDPHTFVSSARSKFTDLHAGAKNFLGGISKSATKLVYLALGKQDLAAMADEGSKFLGPLAWRGWSKQTFPACIKSGEPLSGAITNALKEWRNTLIDKGISKSSDANIEKLKAMGFNVPINATNITIISHVLDDGITIGYWRKSPWGWLPCTQDGKNIINSNNQAVPIENINENIAMGLLTPLIWIKDAGRVEPLSEENAHLLVENNLYPFMPAQTQALG